MKNLFIAFSATLLFGCAVALPPPAQITLGAPKHLIEPPSSSIAGYESVEFAVHFTNTSGQPIWFRAQLREPPFYRLFIRPTETSPWADHTQMECGLGADFHELAPGGSISFTVWVSAHEAGHQLRVELPIYQSPKYTTKPLTVRSEATPIE